MASKYANLLQSRRKESSYLLTEEFTFYEKLAISEENDQGKIYFQSIKNLVFNETSCSRLELDFLVWFV